MMTQLCTHCGSNQFTKNGSYKGVERYQCKSCQRHFSDKPRKFTYQQKAQAIQMYLNKVGIRKIAKFMSCSASLVVKWMKVFGKIIEAQLKNDQANHANDAPLRSVTIEMDELYTFVQTKKQRAVVWTAYCRETGKIVAYVIGERKEAAIQLYEQVKANYPHISYIDTDANSCYGSAFAEHKVKEQHIVTKAETY